MKRHLPRGFYLFGVVSALAAVPLLVAVARGVPGGGAWQTVAIRAGAVILAALAGVAADALWFGRRWAYPATLALAVGYALGVIGWCLWADPWLVGPAVAFLVLMCSSLIVVPVVIYVRDHSTARFGTPRKRSRP